MIEINKDHKSPNCSQRPVGSEIELVVIHYTDGDLESSLRWLINQSSKVSSHYVIARNGEIYQLVNEGWKAWHAGVSSWNGKSSVNDFSIGIELIGWRRGGFTDIQLNSLLWLSKDIMVRNPNVNGSRFVGHSTISPGRKVDPEGIDNQFPWGLFKQALRCSC